jgi:hypothetical protein
MLTVCQPADPNFVLLHCDFAQFPFGAFPGIILWDLTSKPDTTGGKASAPARIIHHPIVNA